VHLEKDYLRHDGTKFPAGGGESMRGRAVSRGEDLSRDDEGRHVGPKIGEEVCETVQRKERPGFVLLNGVWTRIDAGYQKHPQ